MSVRSSVLIIDPTSQRISLIRDALKEVALVKERVTAIITFILSRRSKQSLRKKWYNIYKTKRRRYRMKMGIFSVMIGPIIYLAERECKFTTLRIEKTFNSPVSTTGIFLFQHLLTSNYSCLWFFHSPSFISAILWTSVFKVLITFLWASLMVSKPSGDIPLTSMITFSNQSSCFSMGLLTFQSVFRVYELSLIDSGSGIRKEIVLSAV